MDNKETKLKTTKFFIEANSFEIHQLWKEHKVETKWIEDNSGFAQMIGEINEGMPVVVSFMFAKIFDQRICFYEICSRYSDSQMVENYLVENYPIKWDNESRRAITDSQNFHDAINACNKLSLERKN